MGAKVRVWHLVTIAAGVAAGVWFLLPSASLPAPDFTGQGFNSVRVELRGLGSVGGLSAASDDPALVTELADVLRSGRARVVCRCAALGSLEFRRPDGTAERVLLMPAHDDGSVEFRALGRGQYRVSREWFLRVVGPLAVPAARWYRFPEAELP